LKSAKIDIAVASVSHTRRRDQEIDFSQTYFWSKQTFLVKTGAAAKLDDLVGKPVGVDRGSHAVGNWRDWLTRHGHVFDPKLVVEFGDKQVAIQALRQGAIAGYAQDFEILSSFTRQDPSLVVLESESIGRKQDGVGMRENDSKLRDAINFGLQHIEISGEYERIYLRWFGPASDSPVPLERRIEVWPHG
jgi:polar amino acid transport system substrate-binding protein